MMLKKLVLQCRCLTSNRFKPNRGEDSDVNSDDTLACVSFFLFRLFSLLEIKSCYVLSRIVSFLVLISAASNSHKIQ